MPLLKRGLIYATLALELLIAWGAIHSRGQMRRTRRAS